MKCTVCMCVFWMRLNKFFEILKDNENCNRPRSDASVVQKYQDYRWSAHDQHENSVKSLFQCFFTRFNMLSHFLWQPKIGWFSILSDVGVQISRSNRVQSINGLVDLIETHDWSFNVDLIKAEMELTDKYARRSIILVRTRKIQLSPYLFVSFNQFVHIYYVVNEWNCTI